MWKKDMWEWVTEGVQMTAGDSESNQGQKGLSGWWLFSGFLTWLKVVRPQVATWQSVLFHLVSHLQLISIGPSERMEGFSSSSYYIQMHFMSKDVWFLKLC